MSINKLSQMLRDRYYLGYVHYDGDEIRGRHEPLIDEDLFEQVQDVLNSRATARERRRVRHHYLKGSLFCQRCKRAGTTQRMIVQHTVNSRGAEYTYFFCRNKHNGTCQAPHINVALVEDAVEAHYATVRFSPQFIAEVRAHIAASVIGEQNTVSTPSSTRGRPTTLTPPPQLRHPGPRKPPTPPLHTEAMALTSCYTA